MASIKHTHKYKYVNIGKIDKPNKVYACTKADCTHYMPANSEKLLIGKKTICWQCLKETILTPDMISRHVVKPRCYDCRTGSTKNPKKKEEMKAIDSAVDMLLKMRIG